MSTKVLMPQLGESVVEGTVGKWYKRVGDKIDLYEPIMEVVTDKVTTEIPSPAAGTVSQIAVPEGTTVKAGSVLAVISGPAEASSAPSAPAPQIASPAPTASPSATRDMPLPSPSAVPNRAPTAGSAGASRRLTPVVAKMISENNISDVELGRIPGTGDGGRVSKKDIENYLLTRRAPVKPAPELEAWEQPGSGELFRPTEEVFGKPPSSQTPRLGSSTLSMPASAPKPNADMKDELVSISPMRKSIADHMVRSKSISPHVTSVHEVDMSRVLAHQKAHEQEFSKQGARLTFTAYFVQAAIAALKAWPIVNASYTEQGIAMHRHLNIGIAVAIDEGLIVPVIKDADEKSLLGLARAVNDLAARAREKRLTPDDVTGGTFTLTNFGIFGSLFGMPIINQPQSAILGIGTIQKRPVVRSVPIPGGGSNDAIVILPMCYLSITIDHRLLDGAIGDQFMGVLRKFLETYPA